MCSAPQVGLKDISRRNLRKYGCNFIRNSNRRETHHMRRLNGHLSRNSRTKNKYTDVGYDVMDDGSEKISDFVTLMI